MRKVKVLPVISLVLCSANFRSAHNMFAFVSHSLVQYDMASGTVEAVLQVQKFDSRWRCGICKYGTSCIPMRSSCTRYVCCLDLNLEFGFVRRVGRDVPQSPSF